MPSIWTGVTSSILPTAVLAPVPPVAEFDAEGCNVHFAATYSDVLHGWHGRIRREWVTVCIDFHSACPNSKSVNQGTIRDYRISIPVTLRILFCLTNLHEGIAKIKKMSLPPATWGPSETSTFFFRLIGLSWEAVGRNQMLVSWIQKKIWRWAMGAGKEPA